MTLISSQSDIWLESYDRNTGRCCPSILTVALPLHAISIIRSERPDHRVWHPDGWTSSAWLALSRITSGREHTSSRLLQLFSHNCVWDRNPITCRTLNVIRTVLSRRSDGYTWTLDASRTLNSVWTICHYIRTNATLNNSKLLDTDGHPNGKFSSSERMMLWQMSVRTEYHVVRTNARERNWLIWILHRVFFKLITEV
jgi:hypothetical protein